MQEAEEHPNRLVYVLVVLAFVAYFFLAAVSLPKELALHPIWARNVSKDGGPVPELSGGQLLTFHLGSRYGSVSLSGEVLYSRGAEFDVATSDSVYIPYARDTSVLTAFKLDGSPAFQIHREGWPFFRSGRLFMISPEMNTVSEFASDGKLIWSYDYPFKLSEFDASSSLSIAGLLDGTLECVDRKGGRVFSFAPGGSRVDVILGVAIDSKEDAIAAVCGADRQRFVLLVNRGGSFRVQHHKFLDSDYREPVTVRFSQDGRYVFYRQPTGITVYDRESGKESTLPTRAQSFNIVSDSKHELLFLFAETGQSRTIVCFEPPNRVVFTYPLAGGPSWSRYKDGSLYLGGGAVLGRIDISEE